MRKKLPEKKRIKLMRLLEQLHKAGPTGFVTLSGIAKQLRITKGTVNYYRYRDYYLRREKQRVFTPEFIERRRKTQKEWYWRHNKMINRRKRKAVKVRKLVKRAKELGLI